MSQAGHIAMWNWVAVILVFVQQGCALSFGTQRGTDDDTLFYGSIAFAVVMAMMLICLIISIIRVRKLLMKANREPDMRTKMGYENNIDSIIFDESDMVPIPRVKTLSMKKNENDESKDFDDSSEDEKQKKKKKRDDSSEKPRKKSKKYKYKDYDDSSEDEKQTKKKKKDDSSEEEKPRRKSKKYKSSDPDDSSEDEKQKKKKKRYDSSDSDDSSEDEKQKKKKNRDDSSGEEKPRRKSKKREELQTKTRDWTKKQDTNQARSGRRFANKFPQKA